MHLLRNVGWLAPGLLLWAVTTGFPQSASPPAAPSGIPVEQLAQRLQAHYDGVRDFTADFTQTYRGGVLRKTTTESGNVLVKKPGRMRWTYTRPEEKLFLADGSKMYIYVPADRQVMVRRIPAADTATTPILFLVGKGNLTRDFRAEYTTVAGASPGTVAMRLTPHQHQPDYDWLALVVDPRTLQLRMLVAQDAQGGVSTFSFANMKENVGLPDKSFSFSIPRGVDVITEG